MRSTCNGATTPAVDAGRDRLFPLPRKLDRDMPSDRSSNMMLFPMFLMACDVVVSLLRMEAHQILRARGQLTELAESFAGRVIFISHEWLSFHHPDPDGVQLRTLQRFLERVGAGDLVVTPYYADALAGLTEKAGGAHWKAVMPRCYFWLDFAGVPQNINESDSKMHGFSDHRSDPYDNMSLAVLSIPAYIEASNLLMILVPRAQHRETGRVCTYASWSRRGWCRVEMVCALLAGARVRMIHCVGPEAPVVFVSGGKTAFVPPGLGEFSCCAVGHKVNGRTVPCDKIGLRKVMAALVETSAAHAWAAGDPDRMRFLLCREDYWMQGFPSARADDASRPWMEDLQVFRARLRWGEAYRHSPRPGRTGAGGNPWTVLHWAALTGSATLVREALHEEGNAALNVLVRPMPDFFLTYSGPALSLAAIGSFRTFDAVDVLIKARADPELRLVTGGRVARCTLPQVVLVACTGSAEQLRSWLQRFPHHANYQLLLNGSPAQSALNCLLTHYPDLDDRWRVLQSHGADLRERCPAWGGEGNLIAACNNLNPSLAAVRAMLEARCDVNVRSVPGNLPMKLLSYPSVAIAGLAKMRGRNVSNLTAHFAMVAGGTPLHFAADAGSVEIVHLLLEARAYCQRNLVGETPLQSAVRAFGGAPPHALVQLLAAPAAATMAVKAAWLDG